MKIFIHSLKRASLGGFLIVALLAVAQPAYAAKGFGDKDECGTGTIKDSLDFKYSLRRLIAAYNQGEPYQFCRTKITLQDNVILEDAGLVLSGLPGNTGAMAAATPATPAADATPATGSDAAPGAETPPTVDTLPNTIGQEASAPTPKMVIDGGGHFIDARKLTSGCVISVVGSATPIKIQNLIIIGNPDNPNVDGVCLKTKGTVLSNVRVGRMGRNGIVIDRDYNFVETQSAAILNHGYGILVRKEALSGIDFLASNNVVVNADTIMFGNDGVYASTDATGQSATLPDAGEGKAATAAPSANASCDSTIKTGQNLCVETDPTQYTIDYVASQFAGKDVTEYQMIITLALDPDTFYDPASTPNEVLLLYRSNPKSFAGTSGLGGGQAELDVNILKTLSIDDILLGYASINSDVVPKGLEDPKFRKFSLIDGGFNTQEGDFFFTLNAEDSQVYLRSIPSEATVGSSTATLVRGGYGSNATIYFYDNKGPTATPPPGTCEGGYCNKPKPVPPGGGGTDGTGTYDGNDTEIQQAKADAQNDIKQAQGNCSKYHKLAGGPADPTLDSDGDGLSDFVEEIDNTDCQRATSETDLFNPDTDRDGIVDGDEDGNKNGFVDCVGFKFASDGKTVNFSANFTIRPKFQGLLLPGRKESCEVEFDESGKQTDPAVIDSNVADADGDTSSGCEPQKIGGKLIPLGSSLGANIRTAKDASSSFWPGVPKSAEAFAVVQCNETDPRNSDSDHDQKPDGLELRHKYLDTTQTSHWYDSHGNLLHDASGKAVGCDLSQEGNSADAVALGIAYVTVKNAYLQTKTKLQAYACRSDAIWPDDFKLPQNSTAGNGIDFTSGRTDPRLSDTDKDGKEDLGDECPSKALAEDPSCKAQCASGWRRNQVMEMAVKQLATEGKGAPTGKEIKDKMKIVLQDLKTLFARGTTAAVQQLQQKYQLASKSDDDNIPDLVEAALADSVNGTQSEDILDCGAARPFQTDPFAKFTDLNLFSAIGANAPGKLPTGIVSIEQMQDDIDPCPKTPNKATCKEVRNYAQKTQAAVYACYVDRDNDGLKDCEEDFNLNGKAPHEGGNLQDNEGAYVHVFTGQDKVVRYVGETDPLNPDTDLDGVPDGVEVNQMGNSYWGYTDPNKPNTDADGLSDFDEIARGGDTAVGSLGLRFEPATQKNGTCDFRTLVDTDPTVADTDGDGINDEKEVDVTRTNPTNADSDGDGLCDGNQDVAGVCVAGEDRVVDGNYPQCIPVPGQVDKCQIAPLLKGDVGESNPCDADTDRDNKSDKSDTCKNIADQSCKEPNAMGVDSDSDGIPDATETSATHTDPSKKDTDSDGSVDGCLRDSSGAPIMGTGELCNQVAQGQFFDNFAQLNTSNCGGVPYYGCDTNPNDKDTDKDGMTDKQERNYPTNAVNKDTDGDCIIDGVEDTKFNPDGTPIANSVDGIFTGCTSQAGGKICTETNANASDSDEDGLFDGNGGGGNGANGEDLNCNGFHDVGDVPEFDPRLWDTDGDGFPDKEEKCANGNCADPNNAVRGNTGKPGGCSLANGDAPAATTDKIIWALMITLPMAGLMRMRKAGEEK